ncbi:MAG: 16S rRNA (guanine(966)-N(2))-methyltransferase RsmD [Peptococcaceae bacterium]|nr:16S rRNA (guanine(966)-N(2))-methyltransferase RsmD [Peptococcaceae bacterium]
MRIIAGERRGTKLEAVPGMNTRPTADRVKEGLFNILQMDIDSTTRVLDVFAGTGALGLEALSRGAHHATFIEHAGAARSVLARNIDKCHYKDRATVLAGDARTLLPTLAGQQFDLIFLDPPYQKSLYEPIIFTLLTYHLLSDYGILVSEHAKNLPFSWNEKGLILYKTRAYGDTVLNFFRLDASNWEEK